MKTDKLFQEKVYGEGFISFLYDKKITQFIRSSFFLKRMISKFYGFYNDLSFSRLKIQSFIKKFNIQMQDYLVPEGGFQSFNEFFYREKKEIYFPSEDSNFGSPADARLLVFENKNQFVFRVKGQEIDLSTLTQKSYSELQDSYVWIFRLCPSDYHRYHFPDEGKLLSRERITGDLHSVNPLALKKLPKLFCLNEREVSFLETKNFGKMLYVEVGAICVGKIHQVHEAEFFEKGENKGYFSFGGSTIILVTQKDKIQPHKKILDYSLKGIESLVSVGDCLGKRL